MTKKAKLIEELEQSAVAMHHAYAAQQSNLKNMVLFGDLSDKFLDMYKESDPAIKQRLEPMLVRLLEAFYQCNETGRYLGTTLNHSKAVPFDARPEMRKQLYLMRAVIKIEDDIK